MPYEISHHRVLDCKRFVLNNMKDNLETLDAKENECVFIDYSTSTKAF